MPSEYSENVFINCPFDKDYLPLFHAMVFTVFDCGFVARCAQEIDDSSQIRIEKIIAIIRQCQYGIHDLCRTEMDNGTGLPWFNMPLELGIFLGAKTFGSKDQKKKACLILDCESYRYQKFISDISGQDIRSHSSTSEGVVFAIRNWLRSVTKGTRQMPGGSEIHSRYQEFRHKLPDYCSQIRIQETELTFIDYADAVSRWLKING